MKSKITIVIFLGVMLFSLNSCVLLLVGAEAVSKKSKEKKFDIDKVSELKLSLENSDGALTFSDNVTLKLTFIVQDEKKGAMEYEVGVNNDVAYSDFDITVSGAKIEGRKLIIQPNIEELTNTLKIDVVYKTKPTIKVSKEYNLFDATPVINTEGITGQNGGDGFSGKSSFNGDNNNPCRDGTDGNPGSHGNNGKDASGLEVFVKKIDSPKLGKPVLAIVYAYGTISKITYVDPEKQKSLKIIAVGGKGGDGGNGGSGGDGTSKASGCRGGNGGDAGDGGDGGNGGNVIITIDPNVDLSNFSFDINLEGGDGGDGGNGGNGGNISGEARGHQYSKGRDGKIGRQGQKGNVTRNIQAIPDEKFITG